MTTAQQTQNNAKAAAGKAAKAYLATKGFLARQMARPVTKVILGAALGVAATYGVQKGTQVYRGHRYGPMGGNNNGGGNQGQNRSATA